MHIKLSDFTNSPLRVPRSKPIQKKRIFSYFTTESDYSGEFPIRNSKILKTSTSHTRGSSESPTVQKLVKINNFSKLNYSQEYPKSSKGSNDFQICSQKLNDPNATYKTRKQSGSPYSAKMSLGKNRNGRENSKILRDSSPFFSVSVEIEKKNYAKALELLNSIMKEESPKQYLYLRGICYMNLAEYANAIKDLNEVRLSEEFQFHICI
jgi:tetratricopeptide (TPR) repeat protein